MEFEEILDTLFPGPIANIEYFFLKCNQVFGTHYDITLKNAINLEYLVQLAVFVYGDIHQPQPGCRAPLSDSFLFVNSRISKLVVTTLLVDKVIDYLANFNKLCKITFANCDCSVALDYIVTNCVCTCNKNCGECHGNCSGHCHGSTNTCQCACNCNCGVRCECNQECNCDIVECNDCDMFDCNVYPPDMISNCVCNCNGPECACAQACVCGDCNETCNCKC